MVAVDDAVSGGVPQAAAVLDRQLLLAEMEEVGLDAALDSAGDGLEEGGALAVDGHVDVAGGLVEQLDGLALDGGPVREGIEDAKLLLGPVDLLHQPEFGVGEAPAKARVEVGEDLGGWHGDEAERLTLEGDRHPLSCEAAERLVDLRLGDAGRVGEGVAGEGGAPKQPHVSPRLVLGETQLDQALRRARTTRRHDHPTPYARRKDDATLAAGVG